MKRRDFLRHGISAPGLLNGLPLHRGLGPSLVPAGRALREGRLHIGQFVLRDASAGKPYSLQVFSDLRPYLRVEVRSGDHASWDEHRVPAVDRAEVVVDRSGGSAVIPYGLEFWQQWWMMIEQVPLAPGPWCVLWQHHHSAPHPTIKSINPPFCIAWCTENEPGLVILARRSSTCDVAPTGFVKPEKLYVDHSYRLGQWVCWKARFKYGWQGGAAVQIWRDGNLIVDRYGSDFSIGYEWDSSQHRGVYAQFGIYRSANTLEEVPQKSRERRMVVHFRDYSLIIPENPNFAGRASEMRDVKRVDGANK